MPVVIRAVREKINRYNMAGVRVVLSIKQQQLDAGGVSREDIKFTPPRETSAPSGEASPTSVFGFEFRKTLSAAPISFVTTPRITHLPFAFV